MSSAAIFVWRFKGKLIYVQWIVLYRMLPFAFKGCIVKLIFLYFVLISFKEITYLFFANRVDPDQTPRVAACDLGLHCMTISILWDNRLKWVVVYLRLLG